ncbi:MAG: MogA/MoaB family molybdenum cofactor biosynthesis protein [Anaerotruncus sp.]|jgi:molybdopterin adenylyltransferase|nr:MogA/MoaB family molybdenum cofactor biosynthesis protein [Anaerotruncus sp.]
MFRAAILTASDKGAAGLREDVSGETAKALVQQAGYQVVEHQILPDEQQLLAQRMRQLCDSGAADLILTTGGTGFSPRDRTPEATLEVIERQAPGIAEAMRYASLQITPRAMLSRAVAGIRGRTLIINLPGSPKAVKENLQAILPTLWHGLEILTGQAQECAGKEG